MHDAQSTGVAQLTLLCSIQALLMAGPVSVSMTPLLTSQHWALVGHIAQMCHASFSSLASFPGLHAQLLSLAVRKVEEGLDRFIT